MWFPHTKCRACSSTDLVKVLSLAVQPPANNFTTIEGEREGYCPLEVLYCRNCTLAQLSATVKPEVLYSNYSYVTSASDTMKKHFGTLFCDIGKEVGVRSTKANLLEIGSNNGEFLINAWDLKYNILGI